MSRANTEELESGVVVEGGEEVTELKRGQGLLGKLFGGLPEGSARPRGNSSASARRAGVGVGEASQSERRKQEGGQRLEENDGDSVLGAQSDRMEAVELDDVDGLSKYGGRDEEEEEEDWGDFEKATGATKVVQQGQEEEDIDRRRNT